MFLVNCYLLHVPWLPSQPASSRRGWVIGFTWLNSVFKWVSSYKRSLVRPLSVFQWVSFTEYSLMTVRSSEFLLPHSINFILRIKAIYLVSGSSRLELKDNFYSNSNHGLICIIFLVWKYRWKVEVSVGQC